MILEGMFVFVFFKLCDIKIKAGMISQLICNYFDNLLFKAFFKQKCQKVSRFWL